MNRFPKRSTFTIPILCVGLFGLFLGFGDYLEAESFGFQERVRSQEKQKITPHLRSESTEHSGNLGIPGKTRNSIDSRKATGFGDFGFSTRHHHYNSYQPMILLPAEKWMPQRIMDEDLIFAQASGNEAGSIDRAGSQSSRDWEGDLERELREIEEREKSFEQSRGFTSPTQVDPLTGDRSTQNLMMDLTAAVDLVGAWDNNKPQSTSNGFDVREAEFGFFGAIDQWGRGNLLVAAHNENGKYFFEVHEANVIFPFLSKYVNVKVGRMFLDWGRLNRVHRHDWPFTMAPLVHEKLMDKEAVQDTGAEVSFLMPFFERFSQELVIGVTNGRYWGHTHNAGVNKNNPMVYAHLKNFYYLGNNWGTQFGGTVVRFEPDPDSRTERRQYGLDAVVRWNRGNLRSFMLMGELWYRENRFPNVLNRETFQNESIPMDTQWGYYIFAEYQFHQLWLVGYRYDFFNVPNLRNSRGDYARNAVEANTIQLTFRPSEFSFIRLSSERRYTADFSKKDNNEFWDYRYYIQVTFLLGSHPAHQY